MAMLEKVLHTTMIAGVAITGITDELTDNKYLDNKYLKVAGKIARLGLLISFTGIGYVFPMINIVVAITPILIEGLKDLTKKAGYNKIHKTIEVIDQLLFITIKVLNIAILILSGGFMILEPRGFLPIPMGIACIITSIINSYGVVSRIKRNLISIKNSIKLINFHQKEKKD